MPAADIKENAPEDRKSRAGKRALPIGAEVLVEGGSHFRVCAPRAGKVEVVFEDGPGRPFELTREPSGYFSGAVEQARPGALYRYRLDGKQPSLPDPASRFQPDGPHGASQIVDPRTFKWTDAAWQGVEAHGQVLYEMHIGTFTPEGTWDAAARQLPQLKDLGVTCLEVMP